MVDCQVNPIYTKAPSKSACYDIDGTTPFWAHNDIVEHFEKNCMNIEKFAEMSSGAPPPHPGAAWRQLADRESGFPYYWNTHTNQVFSLAHTFV